jgi:XTP/dITP diphosphohydrolase
MNTLIAATHNKDKLREFREIFPGWSIEADSPDIEETETTFAGNALLKAQAVAARHPGAWVLADDSGLAVDALGGAPGVFSARYAGRDGDNEANNALLMENLRGVGNRAAHYACAIALVTPEGEARLFEGRCDGRIALAPSGTGGFGYDPLFVPDGADRTFANFTPEEKNAISHRGKALEKMRQWMKGHASL